MWYAKPASPDDWTLSSFRHGMCFGWNKFEDWGQIDCRAFHCALFHWKRIWEMKKAQHTWIQKLRNALRHLSHISVQLNMFLLQRNWFIITVSTKQLLGILWKFPCILLKAKYRSNQVLGGWMAKSGPGIKPLNNHTGSPTVSTHVITTYCNQSMN